LGGELIAIDFGLPAAGAWGGGIEGEVIAIDFGLIAESAWGGGMGEEDGDGEGELLLKGFLRIEEPFSVLLIMMVLRKQGSCSPFLQSKLYGS
jgi:hypothetical protein